MRRRVSLVSPGAPNASSGAAARAGPPSSASRSGAEALPTRRANSALTTSNGIRPRVVRASQRASGCRAVVARSSADLPTRAGSATAATPPWPDRAARTTVRSSSSPRPAPAAPPDPLTSRWAPLPKVQGGSPMRPSARALGRLPHDWQDRSRRRRDGAHRRDGGCSGPRRSPGTYADHFQRGAMARAHGRPHTDPPGGPQIGALQTFPARQVPQRISRTISSRSRRRRWSGTSRCGVSETSFPAGDCRNPWLSEVTGAQARDLARAFERQIHPFVTKAFDCGPASMARTRRCPQFAYDIPADANRGPACPPLSSCSSTRSATTPSPTPTPRAPRRAGSTARSSACLSTATSSR